MLGGASAKSLCDALAEDGECAVGGCYALPSVPFESTMCVWREGEHTCPAGFAATTYHDAAIDTRACSSCGCASSSCAVATSIWDAQACTGTKVTLANPMTCTPLTGLVAPASYRADVTPSCTPSGGEVTGTATPDPANAFTVCCAS